MTRKWERIGMDMPTNRWVYSVRLYEVGHWIESQPIHMWKFYDIPEGAKLGVSISALMGQNYIFTDQMEAWFMLRWGDE